MSQRKTKTTIPWSDEEEQYLKDRVINDNVHPMDVMPEINLKFKSGRTRISIERKCCRLRLSMSGMVRKGAQERAEKLSSIQEAKKAVQQDLEKLRLKQHIQTVEAKYKILAREEDVASRMIQVLKDEAQALPKVDLVWTTPESKISKEEAVLLFGDLHVGEKIDKAATYGFGEYNFEIFVKRLKFLAESIKNITVRKLRGYEVETLHIIGLGDMISGVIHEELKENAEDMMFQVLNGAFVTAQFILELKMLFKNIKITGVLGNHGRIKKQMYYKKRYVNWDYVFYQFLGTFLTANKDISCEFPKSFFSIKQIYDYNFLILHGDSIRSWMGIPWYGIERAMWRLGDLLQAKDIKVHYRVLGHFHRTGELDKTPGEIILNGSFSGGSEYSLISFFEFDRPTQLFFGVHKNIGVTWRYPLRLDLPGVDNVIPYNYNDELDAAKYMRQMLDGIKGG